jgi:hypothetical protein
MASSVFSTINASVPCQTSDFVTAISMVLPYWIPIG